MSDSSTLVTVTGGWTATVLVTVLVTPLCWVAVATDVVVTVVVVVDETTDVCLVAAG